MSSMVLWWRPWIWPKDQGFAPLSLRQAGNPKGCLKGREGKITIMKKIGVLKFISVTVLFFAFIIAWLGFGERGFIHLYRMEKDRQAYAVKIEQLREKNRELLEEIERLRSDDKYIESLARREFDLIKDDEVLYRFSGGDGRVRTKNQSRNSGQP